MSAVRQEAPREEQARASLFVLAGGHGALHWSVAIFYLLLPFIKAEFALNYAQTGLLATIVHVSSFIANIPGGIIVDVTGRRTAIQLT